MSDLGLLSTCNWVPEDLANITFGDLVMKRLTEKKVLRHLCSHEDGLLSCTQEGAILEKKSI